MNKHIFLCSEEYLKKYSHNLTFNVYVKDYSKPNNIGENITSQAKFVLNNENFKTNIIKVLDKLHITYVCKCDGFYDFSSEIQMPEKDITINILLTPKVDNLPLDEEIQIIKTQEDIEKRIANNEPIILTNDVKLENCLVIENDKVCNIDLNGHTITAGKFRENNGQIEQGNSDSYVFWNKGGKLIISGNGKVVAQSAKYSMAVWCQGGETVINGGDFYNSGEGSDLIYASKTGNIVINNGYFESCVQQNVPGTKNKRSALNVRDADYKSGSASITVFGGTFLEFDPMNNLSEGENTNYVAEGHSSVENGNLFDVLINLY